MMAADSFHPSSGASEDGFLAALGQKWREMRDAPLPAGGGQPRPLTRQFIEVRGWDWLPDSRGVAFGRRVDSETRLAWRQGWLNYYQAPLAQVVDELSRYYPGRIVLLGDALGQRKVSGSFPANDPLAALDALGTVVGFERKTLLGRVTLLR